MDQAHRRAIVTLLVLPLLDRTGNSGSELSPDCSAHGPPVSCQLAKPTSEFNTTITPTMIAMVEALHRQDRLKNVGLPDHVAFDVIKAFHVALYVIAALHDGIKLEASKKPVHFGDNLIQCLREDFAMYALGLFDVTDHLARLSATGDPLEALGDTVDF